MDTEIIELEVSNELLEEVDTYSDKLELDRTDTLNVLLSFAVTHFGLYGETKKTKGLRG